MKDVPSDYYRRLHAIESSHWWPVGMRDVTAALLGRALARHGAALLDAGCGTGGFLAWARNTGAFDRLCGIDISPEAIEVARRAVPEAELRVSSLHALPFEEGSFDVVALNDVLQHIDERELDNDLAELRRVLRTSGTLLVRTNGGRRARRERSDWRLYDERALRSDLERGGFEVVRMTHANALLSAWDDVRGRGPKPPTSTSCGIPRAGGAITNTVGRAVLGLEARYLRNPRRGLPYGHTLLALAVPAASA